MSDNGNPDRIDIVRARLRDDLRAALKAKAIGEAAVLRTLIAALDNAEAVAAPAGHARYVVRQFGDPATEVSRKRLTGDEVDAVLAAERDERLSAAADLAAAGRPDAAEQLRADAALVERYLPARD